MLTYFHAGCLGAIAVSQICGFKMENGTKNNRKNDRKENREGKRKERKDSIKDSMKDSRKKAERKQTETTGRTERQRKDGRAAEG